MGNIGNIAKVVSIKKLSSDNKKTVANSLHEKGFNRQPGAAIRLHPYKEADERFRTGLDENAAYIDKMPEEQQPIERERIKTLRDKLERLTRLDLDSRSEYYTGIYGEKFGTRAVASSVKLKEGENVFNLDDSFDAIAFAWVSVHPFVAASYEHYRTGKAGPGIQFYVSNPEVEDKIVYNESKSINKAIVELDNMTPEKMKMIGKLLGLPISENDTEHHVYIQLDKFIKSGEIKLGDNKGFRAIALFNNVINLKDDILVIKALIKDSITHGVYSMKAGIIYEGTTVIANDEDMLLRKLASTKGQVEYLALEKKLEEKKINAR